MADAGQIERLDAIIDAVVAGRSSPDIDPDLAMLAVIAADLRDVPNRGLKARLARQLFGEKGEDMQATATATTAVTEVRPYFIVTGADDLIAFLKTTFDAEVLLRVPAPDGTVRHAEVRVGDSLVEIGEAGGEWKPIAAPLHIYLDDVDGAYRRAISAGATSLYEPVNQPYGDREAGVVDQRGIQWFLARRLKGEPRPAGFGMVATGFRAAEAKRMIEFLENAFGAVHVSGDIGHAEIRIGGSMVELSQAHDPWGPTIGAYHLFVTDCDAVYADAVRAGGTTMWAPEDKPYGERTAGITDPWGNQWFIATPIKVA